jgi:hypothetical protein
MSAKAPLPRASRNSAKKDSSRLPPGEKFGNERGERFNPGKTVEPSICRRASFPSARWPTFLWRVMQAIRTTFCPAASGQKLPQRILRLRKWIPDIEILVDSERVGSRLGARQHIFLEPLRPGIEPTRIFPNEAVARPQPLKGMKAGLVSGALNSLMHKSRVEPDD